MPDRKISDLTDGGALQDTDELVVARSGANYKIAGAAIGGSTPVVSAHYGATGVTIAPLTWTNPNWAKLSGTSLFDLTDPANPVALAAGYYTVDLEAQFNGASGTEAGKSAYVEADIDLNGDDPNVATNFSLDPANRAGLSQINQSVSIEAFCPVGGVVNFAVQHSLSADATAFVWNAYVKLRAQATI